MHDEHVTGPSYAATFHTTRWTRVCAAKADSDEGRCALADLCDAYYEPVVAYLRSALRDADAARDMSHAFFAEMLGGGRIESADRDRGRFRSYLLGAVKHFVSRQREMRRSLKRGVGVEVVSLEENGVAEVRDGSVASPDAAFDRQWSSSFRHTPPGQSSVVPCTIARFALASPLDFLAKAINSASP